MNPSQDPVMLLLPEQRVQAWADRAWPLRFTSHDFDAACWNVQRCSIIYDHHEFGTTDPYVADTVFRPVGPPEPDWQNHRNSSYGISPEDHGGNPFPPDPIKLDWTSLDGSRHAAMVDLDAIFKDRLVLHNVKREDIPPVYFAPPWLWDGVHILLEVNDRTVNVYSKAYIVVGDRQNLDDIDKRKTRRDLILAWTHTY